MLHFYADVENSRIDLGDGADTLQIDGAVSNTTIYGGSDNDFVAVSNFNGGTFGLGSGADTLLVSNWASSSTLNISAVEGALRLAGTDSHTATIQIDRLTSGSNFVLGDSLANKAVHVTEHQGGAIDIGSGTGNTLSFDSITGNSSVTAAHFEVGTISGQLSAQRAAGTSITVKNAMTATGTSVTTGTGNDTLNFNAAISNTSVSAGGGNDIISGKNVANSHISTGDGNDSISFASTSGTVLINTGSGNNTVSLTTVASSTVTVSGTGSDTLEVGTINNASFDYSSSSSAPALTFGAAQGNSTITGVSGATNSITVNTLGAGSGTVQLGGTSATVYDVLIKNSADGSFVSGSGQDTLTLGVSGQTWNAGQVGGGHGNDNITMRGNFVSGVISGNEIVGESTVSNTISANSTVGFDNDIIRVTSDVTDSLAVIYGDIRQVSSIKATAVGGTGLMCDTIILEGTGDNSVTIYGDAYSVDWITLTGEAGSGIFADWIELKGTFAAGKIIGDMGGYTWDSSSLTLGAETLHITDNNREWLPFVGCDTICVRNMTGGSIASFFGNDLVVVGAIDGSGDVTTLGAMSGGEIYGHVGDDTILVGTLNGGSVSGALDNDSINIRILQGNGAVYGDDSVDHGGDTTGDADTIVIGDMLGGTVNAGQGHDSISITKFAGGTIEAGRGDDVITIGEWSGGTISLGEGKDSVAIGKIIAGSQMSIDLGSGDGPDTVDLSSLTLEGSTIITLFGIEAGDVLKLPPGSVDWIRDTENGGQWQGRTLVGGSPVTFVLDGYISENAPAWLIQ